MNQKLAPDSTRDDLARYGYTVASQHGEDGILEEIFRRIGVTNSYCIEFGAWEGRHLSNTWSLWHDKGWSALLIEGDPERYHRLVQEAKLFKKVQTLNAFVQIHAGNCLDSILAQFDAPKSPDLLSIDIDGDDYHVFESLKTFSPRVVVIEYNPTIPPELDLVQSPGNSFGCSASAMVRLAHSRGYRLACCTTTNCIFVQAADFPPLGIAEPSISGIFDRSNLNYIIEAFDGSTYITRNPYYSHLRRYSMLNILRRYLRQLLQRKSRSTLLAGNAHPLREVQVFRRH